MRRSAIFMGFNPSLMESQARDRVDGAIGLAALGVGFVFQALAYTFTFGGLGGMADGGSFRRGFAALTMSALGVAFVLLVWRLLRRRLVNRTIVAVAHLNYETEPMERSPKAYAGVLRATALEAGYEQEAGEDVHAFARRVYGVETGPDINPHPPARQGDSG